MSRWISPAWCAADSPLSGLEQRSEAISPRPRLHLQPHLERHAFDQLHRHEHLIAVATDVIDLDDVRV
ncbi:MAG: hypothetical protein IPK80_00240 [Nannocystis sp.]|nr:hypothetical protein [Nannocystis sp.]